MEASFRTAPGAGVSIALGQSLPLCVGESNLSFPSSQVYVYANPPPAKQFTDGGLNEPTVSLEAEDFKKKKQQQQKNHQAVFDKLLSHFLQGSISEASFLSQNSATLSRKCLNPLALKWK